MHCPNCGRQELRVIDSRSSDEAVRRRRKCLACGARFTTYERIHLHDLFVIKKDGRREEFNRQKLYEGMVRACAKRPVSAEDLEEAVRRVEMRLYALGQAEVEYRAIGEMVMDELRKLDEVAYVRFASVYRHFSDLETMKEEVDGLLAERGD